MDVRDRLSDENRASDARSITLERFVVVVVFFELFRLEGVGDGSGAGGGGGGDGEAGAVLPLNGELELSDQGSTILEREDQADLVIDLRPLELSPVFLEPSADPFSIIIC